MFENKIKCNISLYIFNQYNITFGSLYRYVKIVYTLLCYFKILIKKLKYLFIIYVSFLLYYFFYVFIIHKNCIVYMTYSMCDQHLSTELF